MASTKTSIASSTSSSSAVESSPSMRPTSSRDGSCEPPRKRARSELNSDQRKEARAHRNRIAAQHSRDKRKAQFAHLERRVAELEEENSRLRAGSGLSQIFKVEEHKVVDIPTELSMQRENQELKERIRSLESGWSAVVQALQASGLPLNIPAAPAHSIMNSSAFSDYESSTSALPICGLQNPVVPISPALSYSSLSSSSALDEFEPTRHLARVATIEDAQLTSMSLQRVASQQLKCTKNSQRLLTHRLLTTTRVTNWSWRSSFERLLHLSRPHRQSLYLSRLFHRLPKSSLMRRHPFRRRR